MREVHLWERLARWLELLDDPSERIVVKQSRIDPFARFTAADFRAASMAARQRLHAGERQRRRS